MRDPPNPDETNAGSDHCIGLVGGVAREGTAQYAVTQVTSDASGPLQITARGLNAAGQLAGVKFLNVSGTSLRAFFYDGVMYEIGVEGLNSNARALNASGQVIGQFISADNQQRGFIWSKSGGLVELGSLEVGGAAVSPEAINGSGQVVGTGFAASQFRAFRWTESTGPIDLLGHYSQAIDINDSGWVVGQHRGIAGDFRAFVWSDDGGLTDLGRPYGQQCYAMAINSAGQVVVTCLGTGDDGVYRYKNYLWSQTTGLVEVDTSGLGREPVVTALNDSGQAVGRYLDASSQYRAFSWTMAGGAIDIGTIGGGIAFANDVNSSGEIIGVTGTSGSFTPFVFSGGTMSNLNNVIPPGGLALTGALAIADSGIIVAQTSNPNTLALLTPGQRVTTPIGSDVAVSAPATLPNGAATTVELMFDNIEIAGETTVLASAQGPPPPSGFKLTNPPVYYEITTTATFSGTVRVCLSWSEGQITNEASVELFHFDDSELPPWDNITDVASRDTVNNTVCGTTTSLSPFVLAEPSYTFTGFFQPVDNAPTKNTVKAGAAVPVRFSLNGDQGLGVFSAGYPASQLVPCETFAPADAVEETSAAAASSLSFDQATSRYTYVWKTDRAWAGSCRRLVLQFNDGTLRTAHFNFSR